MTYEIGFDARMIAHTGIGTYVKGLLRNFHNASARERKEFCLYGKEPLRQDYPKFSFEPFRSGIYSVQEQFGYRLKLPRCRLWHAPHYNVPVMKSRTKVVVTIHDIIHWVFRNEFLSPVQKWYAGSMLKRAVQDTDHVITVSHHTKHDLVQYFDADPDRISVIYEGIGPEFKTQDDSQVRARLVKKYQVPEKYFLYVGLLKPHKNVKWLADVFQELRTQGRIQSSLVIVGKKDKKYPKEYQSLADLGTRKGLVYLPYVETDELVQLYNDTIALIHPSRYEGFGLTLLEAMACGAPVVACRTASLPEIAGDAAHLIDPCSHHELEDALTRLEAAPHIREDFRRRGWKHAQKFQWSETARQTLNVYEKVLSKS